MMCDIIVKGKPKFGQPEVNLGTIAAEEPKGVKVLVSLKQWKVLSGDLISANEAKEFGLYQYLSYRSTLNKTLELAERIASNHCLSTMERSEQIYEVSWKE